MLKKVIAYKNTGFDGVNIPATPDVLEAAGTQISSISYDDVYFLREDIDNPVIRINDTYDHLKYVDYVKIVNSTTPTSEPMYYFAQPKAIAQKTTAIYLQLDALTTMGGAAALTYTSGWQTRGHVSAEEDTLFGNISDENFVPSQEMQIANMQVIDGNTSAGSSFTTDIITTSVDLTDLYPGTSASTEFGEFTAKVFEGKVNPSDTEAKMYWPAIKACFEGTEYDVRGDVFSLPQNCAFRYNNQKVKGALNKLFSIGQLSLQSSYRLPSKWYDTANTKYKSGTDDTQYAKITGYSGKESTNIRYENLVTGYAIKNKKCHALFRKICLQSVSTGDLCIKRPSEVYETGTEQKPITTVQVDVWSDPSALGRPYARFHRINSAGSANQIRYDGCVKGSQWVNNQLVLEGASGSVWNALNTAFSNASIQRNLDNQQDNNRAQHILNQKQLDRMKNTPLGGTAMDDLFAFGKDIVGAVGAGVGAASFLGGGAAGAGGTALGTAAAAGSGPLALGLGAAALAGTALYSATENSRRSRDLQIESLESQISRYGENKLFAQAQARQAINENNLNLQANNLQSPTVMFSPDPNLALYGYNYFIVYEVVMKDDDIKALDKYFQRFGYSGLHRPLDASCFSKRSKFNYVEAYDVSIGGNWPMRIRMAGVSQLNSGVRAWWEKPNTAAYDTN